MDDTSESYAHIGAPITAPEPTANLMPPAPATHRLSSAPDIAAETLLAHGLQYSQPDDRGALTAAQRAGLLRRLHAERLADREYLRTHPEVQAIVQLIFAQVERRRPAQLNVFLSEYFQLPIGELRLAVQQQLDRLQSSRENLVGEAGDSQCGSPQTSSSADTESSSW